MKNPAQPLLALSGIQHQPDFIWISNFHTHSRILFGILLGLHIGLLLSQLFFLFFSSLLAPVRFVRPRTTAFFQLLAVFLYRDMLLQGHASLALQQNGSAYSAALRLLLSFKRRIRNRAVSLKPPGAGFCDRFPRKISKNR